MIDCRCNVIDFPTCFPVVGSQTQIWEDLLPEASLRPFGDQAMQRTWSVCPERETKIYCTCNCITCDASKIALPLQVNCGVSVFTSQNLTVVSPEPLAKNLTAEEILSLVYTVMWSCALVHLPPIRTELNREDCSSVAFYCARTARDSSY